MKNSLGHGDSVVVSDCEINHRHGTGLLIQYLFEDFRNLVTVCASHNYDGERVPSATHHSLSGMQLERHQVYQEIREMFANAPPSRAYVVPFSVNSFIIGMALKDLFGVKICLHLMDDNCLNSPFSFRVPDHLMTEALSKADIRFANSVEMRDAYEQRFGGKFWLLPPIVPESSIARQTVFAEAGQRGIVLGNIWDKQWLRLLCDTIDKSNLEVDWFCNNDRGGKWLNISPSEAVGYGIHLHSPLWGDDLIREVRRRPFAVVPSGVLNEEDTRHGIAQLSLPSRITYLTAMGNIPLLILGSSKTCAARFVSRFQLGQVAGYDGAEFQIAVSHLTTPSIQESIRSRASAIGPLFSARGLQQWLWESLDCGEPVDTRFEQLFL